MTEVEMVGWHHGLNEHKFEQALGVGDGSQIVFYYTYYFITLIVSLCNIS